MKINHGHREKLSYYLKEFYKRHPREKYTVFHYVKFMKARLKKNKDAWVGLSGDTGVGKSYFALMTMILFGRPMDLDKNVSYLPTGDEITKKLGKLNFQAFLVDEAAREMRAVNWHSKAQQGVNVKAMTDRFLNNLVYLNMPSFSEFTKSMRVRNFQFRIVCLYRTETHVRVIVQRKSRNWRSEDPWGDDEAAKKYKAAEKKYGELTNEIILQIEKSLAQTVMDFIVPNLALILPDIVEEYERIKFESRQEKGIDQEGVKNSWKDKYEEMMGKVSMLIMHNPLGVGHEKMTQAKVAAALGVSVSTFRKYLEVGKNQVSFYDKKKAVK